MIMYHCDGSNWTGVSAATRCIVSTVYHYESSNCIGVSETTSCHMAIVNNGRCYRKHSLCLLFTRETKLRTGPSSDPWR